MQIIALELHNFKKYYLQDDYQVSFLNKNNEPYQLILINGRNGSGKSTICDALCVAFSTGTKRTYENKKFELPTDLQSGENLKITVQFKVNPDDLIIHTITRTATRSEKNTDTWSTLIDNKLVAESKVGAKLAELGINGLDNFLVSIHPLYLINPDNASRKEALTLFFKLMNEAARSKLNEIIKQDLATATFNNPLINQEEPLFQDDELEAYYASPLSILQSIKDLTTSNKSFDKELKNAQDEYLLLEKTSKFLSSEELNGIKTEIYNKTSLMETYSKQLEEYNALISKIKYLEQSINDDTQSINYLKDKPHKDQNNPQYQKNLKIRTTFLNLIETYKTKNNEELRNLLTTAHIAEVNPIDHKVKVTNEEIKPILSKLKDLNSNLTNNLTALLDVYYPLANLNYDEEINDLIKSKEKKQAELEQQNKELAKKQIDLNTIKQNQKMLQDEILALNVTLGNDRAEHKKLDDAKKNFEYFRKQNLYLIKNQTKTMYLNDAKEKCLNTITEFVNSKCTRANISLYSTRPDGTKEEDFQIISKNNHTSYYEMNKAEQWLCGYELANLFQSFNHASLPIIFDGAESIDLSEQVRLIRQSFNQETTKSSDVHQLMLLNVSNSNLKVTGFSNSEFKQLYNKQ